MRYREKLTIVIMRDNGPRRSFTLRRSNFFLLLVFFACLPFLCLLLTTQTWLLWQENIKLRESMERSETDFQELASRAERLEQLEELLNEANVQPRQIIARQLASSSLPDPGPEEPAQADADKGENGEGPGHEEFPAVDTGRVKVSNVVARSLRGNRLRIALDLRNPDNEPLLGGEVKAILITANGERTKLDFVPKETAYFRISRFKRTVITAPLPRNANLTNAQILLEVLDQDDKQIYSNVFAVQR